MVYGEQWEYKVYSFHHVTQGKDLNDFGYQGWELVAANENFLYLKRKKG